ncbi:MAG: YdeI/OmpD-associated family protein [Chloroflexi bacterium]|nr:YdeI/OmpD-associated family protein [Chloroflexota bacterium]OJV90623.1 MAG: bacteriocin-protection protein, YdeI/OmpD-associated family [Chloroflexi bacterium 54-19]
MPTPKELMILPFASAFLWKQWLAEHFSQADGVWLKIAKKESKIASVTYDEALDEALCYGWIDGQRKSFDNNYFLQKFTPRRPGSLWSKRNINKVAELTAANRMHSSGLAEVETARADGRWEAAYDSARNMVIPEDFLVALEENNQAKVTFETLNQTNLYTIVWRLQTARNPETRRRRLETILATLEKGEKFH